MSAEVVIVAVSGAIAVGLFVVMGIGAQGDREMNERHDRLREAFRSKSAGEREGKCPSPAA